MQDFTRAKAFESDFEVGRKIMNVNYFRLHISGQASKMIREASEVKIAVVTSISDFWFPMRSAYCASNTLFGFLRSLDLENPNIRLLF